MAGYGCGLVVIRVDVDTMIASIAEEITTTRLKMSDDVKPFHDVTTKGSRVTS